MKSSNKLEFETLLKNNEVILVDFFATWCGPCRMLAPIIEELAEEVKDRFPVIKIDVDEENELAGLYRVSSIPTIIVFKDGKPFDIAIGYRSKQNLIDMLEKAASK